MKPVPINTPSFFCRTFPEREEESMRGKSCKQEELDEALRQLGLDWGDVQKLMAPSLGIDPSDIGSLNEATVIIATDWPGALEGSTCHNCAGCNAALALSPASAQALLARPEILVLCLKCAREAQALRHKEGE